MTTYFTAPDGHGEPTLWAQLDGHSFSQPVMRRCDFGDMAHHWDELVARVIAGNPPTDSARTNDDPVAHLNDVFGGALGRVLDGMGAPDLAKRARRE